MKLSYPADRPKLKPALRQTLAGRADMAIAEVANHGRDASIFALRKRTKEIRGLLRLLRNGWDDARDWNARIGDAAAQLAPARDAEVMLATFDSLTARRRTPSDFDSLRDALLDEMDIADAATDPDANVQFAATMAEFAHAARKLKIHGKTSPLVWNNLSRIWEKTARAYKKAAQSGEVATAFHDWRKMLKQHWYQARFFKPIDRKGMRGHIAQVDALARVLGAHNDHDVLLGFLRATCPVDPALARLEPDLLSARVRLARQALDMADRLYARPNPADAWAHQWQEWRAG